MISKRFITELYRFGVVGVVGFSVNYGVLSLTNGYYQLNHVISEIIAMVVALQITFILHDTWTYKEHKLSQGYSHGLRVRYGSYLLSNIAGSTMTIVGYSMLYHHLHRFLALAVAAIVGMLWNFCINRFVVWKHHKLQASETNLTQA